MQEFPAGVEAGLRLHQETVFQTLNKALRLTFPTVLHLTGESCFSQVAADYARLHPSSSPLLYGYGANFPQFLGSHVTARGYPYFYDTARFDWAIDQAGHKAPEVFGKVIPIAVRTKMRLAVSLTCLRFHYPVDLIRDALEAGRPEDLASPDIKPGEHYIAIWRGRARVSAKTLSAPAAIFLQAIMDGCDADAAICSAMEDRSLTEAIAAIQLEVLASSFARVTSAAKESVAP
jgi:hypothetical protein